MSTKKVSEKTDKEILSVVTHDNLRCLKFSQRGKSSSLFLLWYADNESKFQYFSIREHGFDEDGIYFIVEFVPFKNKLDSEEELIADCHNFILMGL